MALAKLAVERDCGRVEWSVLNWNEPSIEFYKRSTRSRWTSGPSIAFRANPFRGWPRRSSPALGALWAICDRNRVLSEVLHIVLLTSSKNSGRLRASKP